MHANAYERASEGRVDMTARTHEHKPLLADGAGAPTALSALRHDSVNSVNLSAIGGSGAGGGGKADAFAPSHGVAPEHRPQAIDVAAGLGLGAALTLSLALALEGAPLGAGTAALTLAATLAMLHQEAHP